MFLGALCCSSLLSSWYEASFLRKKEPRAGPASHSNSSHVRFSHKTFTFCLLLSFTSVSKRYFIYLVGNSCGLGLKNEWDIWWDLHLNYSFFQESGPLVENCESSTWCWSSMWWNGAPCRLLLIWKNMMIPQRLSTSQRKVQICVDVLESWQAPSLVDSFRLMDKLQTISPSKGIHGNGCDLMTTD